MIKTKRQLRAEAVERLQNHDDDSIIQEVESTIELLSDGTDSREKLEADALDCLRIWISNHDPQLRGHGLAALETIADMIERDYVRRGDYYFMVEMLRHMTAERDKWKAKAEQAEHAMNKAAAESRNTTKQPISQFDVPKSGKTTENSTAKNEIRDFDDTREKFEMKVDKLVKDGFVTYAEIIELLDRKDAITEHEWEIEQAYINGGYKEQIAELTEELDNARAKNRLLKAHIGKMQNGRNGWHIRAVRLQEKVDELTAERDLYREKLSRALDLAHEIERLMP